MRWTVRQGDGPTVDDVLARARADALAVDEGRVFVGRRRVKKGDERVDPGDVVDVAPARDAIARPGILLRTPDLVAVDKPAGMPTIADHGGASHALVASAARALGLEPAALHPTSRLDRDVSGVVVLALDAQAARRLADARASGAYVRRYVALAARSPDPPAGEWSSPIGRANDPRRRAVGGRDPAAAVTRYRTCARTVRGEALLAVAPGTGRTHQIRVHAAHAGAPLLGDRTYGGPARITLAGGQVLQPRRVALHAAVVSVPGAAGETLTASSPVPDDLRELWASLGGAAGAWEEAIACAV